MGIAPKPENSSIKNILCLSRWFAGWIMKLYTLGKYTNYSWYYTHNRHYCRAVVYAIGSFKLLAGSWFLPSWVPQTAMSVDHRSSTVSRFALDMTDEPSSLSCNIAKVALGTETKPLSVALFASQNRVVSLITSSTSDTLLLPLP